MTGDLHVDPYERQARVELDDWRRQMLRAPNAFDRACKGVQTRITAIIPERVHAAITAVIERMTRAVLVGSDFTTARPLLNASLRHREERVRRTLDAYRKTAAVEGGVAGAGGFLFAAADFPVLIGIKLKLLFEVAALYGRETNDFAERLHILSIFQLAFSSPDHRRAVFETLTDWERTHHARPATMDDFDWRRFQQEYRDYIDIAKMAQMLPIVGAPIGAVVNYRLLDRLGTTAIGANRLRWFEETAVRI